MKSALTALLIAAAISATPAAASGDFASEIAVEPLEEPGDEADYINGTDPIDRTDSIGTESDYYDEPPYSKRRQHRPILDESELPVRRPGIAVKVPPLRVPLPPRKPVVEAVQPPCALKVEGKPFSCLSVEPAVLRAFGLDHGATVSPAEAVRIDEINRGHLERMKNRDH